MSALARRGKLPFDHLAHTAQHTQIASVVLYLHHTGVAQLQGNPLLTAKLFHFTGLQDAGKFFPAVHHYLHPAAAVGNIEHQIHTLWRRVNGRRAG